MKVYGIKNCNTVKKTLDWLDAKGLTYEFHDYKSKGIRPEKLLDWCQQVGWEALVNKRGTTWRKLTPEEQSSVKDTPSAIALMAEKTSVIKRPLIETEGKVITLGFDEAELSTKLG
jgi:arsenate reductase (glutaredoxin)